METLVKFRLLHDTLNEEEQQLFLTTVIKSFGMKFIVTAIFNHFSQRILQYKSYDIHQIQTINAFISDIIHDRDPPQTQQTDVIDEPIDDKEETSNHLQLKLDDLAPPLISHISSYLQQRYYSVFAKINRKIFIGCNSPFSVLKIDIHLPFNVTKQIIDKTKLKHVEVLETTMEYFNNYINAICNASHFTNLHHLNLNTAKHCQIMHFVQQKCINLSNIKHLKISDFAPVYEIPITTSLFMKFLSLFTNIEYFETVDRLVLNDDYNESNIPYFTKLKIVELYHEEFSASNQFEISLINKHSEQIQAFSCEFEISELKPLPNLRELNTFDINDNFWNFIHHTNHLQRLSLEYGCDIQQIESILVKVLHNQPNFEFFECELDVNEYLNKEFWDEFVKGFAKGLDPLQETEKNVFNVKLSVWSAVTKVKFDACDGLIPCIKTIATKLSQCNVDNFMIKCKLDLHGTKKYTDDEILEIENKLKCFDDLFLVNYFSDTHLSYRSIQIVVSNPENKLRGGYRQYDSMFC